MGVERIPDHNDKSNTGTQYHSRDLRVDDTAEVPESVAQSKSTSSQKPS